MELKITVEEAKQILLKWAQFQCPEGKFNSVEHETYSYLKTFVFTQEEPTDAAQ
jgi:DNA-directed RNA polymerase subunit F